MTELKLRSRDWFGRKGKDGLIYRAWMKNQGIPAHQFEGKPVIGICNTWSELTPCNGHLRDLAESVKNGIYEVSLTFKEKGELEATSSTNYLTGFYETSQQNSIQLDGDGTERKETSWGNLFVNALPHVNIYDLESDRLVLSCDDKSQLIFNRIQ